MFVVELWLRFITPTIISIDNSDRQSCINGNIIIIFGYSIGSDPYFPQRKSSNWCFAISLFLKCCGPIFTNTTFKLPSIYFSYVSSRTWINIQIPLCCQTNLFVNFIWILCIFFKLFKFAQTCLFVYVSFFLFKYIAL